LNWRAPTYVWQKWYRRIARHRYCTGYRRTLYIFRTVQQCGNWVRQVDPRVRWFFFREQSNWHCSPCPSRYRGHPTQYTAVDNRTNINIFMIRNMGNPGWMRRWVRSVDKEARYFMFRLTGNFHCSPCPMHYTGGTTRTHADNSVMHIYRITGWRSPKYRWHTTYRRIAIHRYCKGYRKKSHSYRNVVDCANWVRGQDKEARYFFFREQSNWHCSPCPHYYTGHPTTGTVFDKNTRIHIYRILNWKAPTYGW
jgi:hypothetical protein